MWKRHKRRVWPCREQERVCRPCEDVSSRSLGFTVQHLQREGRSTQGGGKPERPVGWYWEFSEEGVLSASQVPGRGKKKAQFWVTERARGTQRQGRVDYPRRPQPGRLARLDTCHFLFTGLRFPVKTVYLNADVMSSARTNPERLRPRRPDSSAASRDLIGLKWHYTEISCRGSRKEREKNTLKMIRHQPHEPNCPAAQSEQHVQAQTPARGDPVCHWFQLV